MKDYTKKQQDLMRQVDKIAKHNRQGSFKTKERYYGAMQNFTKHLADNYGLQKVANISDKHLHSYVEEMKSKNLSASTIKTNLSAIRFFHDKFPKTRNILSSNEAFNLEKRDFIGSDKSWLPDEYNRIKEHSERLGNDLVHDTVVLARNEGLRIHEALRIDRATAVQAIKTGELEIKGKGGKIRSVPLTEESKQLLTNRVAETPHGAKLFVQEDEKTHLVIKRVQNFISRHQNNIVDESRSELIKSGENITDRITFHGLRHTYAQEQYQKFRDQGYTEYQSRLEVSRLLGHERDDVTKIYIT